MAQRNMLAIAIALASEKFKDISDRGGKPYILHCIRVMMNVDNHPERQQIAILHDIVEDTDVTIKDLMDIGFSPRVVAGVLTLTKTDEIEYDDYIRLIASNEDARIVKLADLKDNFDISRLKGLTKKDFDRMEKYQKAYTYLSQV